MVTDRDKIVAGDPHMYANMSIYSILGSTVSYEFGLE